MSEWAKEEDMSREVLARACVQVKSYELWKNLARKSKFLKHDYRSSTFAIDHLELEWNKKTLIRVGRLIFKSASVSLSKGDWSRIRDLETKSGAWKPNY